MLNLPFNAFVFIVCLETKMLSLPYYTLVFTFIGVSNTTEMISQYLQIIIKSKICSFIETGKNLTLIKIKNEMVNLECRQKRVNLTLGCYVE